METPGLFGGTLSSGDPLDFVRFTDMILVEGSVSRLYIAHELASPLRQIAVSWADIGGPTGSFTTRVALAGKNYEDATLTTDVADFNAFYVYVLGEQTGPGNDIDFSRTLDFGNTWISPYSLATSVNGRLDLWKSSDRIQPVGDPACRLGAG